MRIAALDIETVCDIVGCPGYGKSDNTCTDDKGKKMRYGHALDPWRNRITQIGIWEPNNNWIFNNADDFRKWVNRKDRLCYDFVGHNFKFDLLTLWAKDVQLPLQRWAGDTKLMAHVCTEKIPEEWLGCYNIQRQELNKKLPPHIEHRLGTPHSLKTLAPYLLDVEPFWEDPTNHESNEYVLKDCEYTYQLWEYLEDRLCSLNQLEFYEDKLLPWAKMLFLAEWRGVRIDLDKLEVMKQEDIETRYKWELQLCNDWNDAYEAYEEKKKNEILQKYMLMEQVQLEKHATSDKQKKICWKYEKLYQDAIKRASERGDLIFSLSSPSQMLWLLRDYFKLDVTNYKDEESTGDEVCEKLAREHNRKDIEIYLKWREVNKRLTSYYPLYERLHVDGIIHPEFDVCGTRTGRLSSRNPNFQNIPPYLECLLIPRDGYKFIKLDAASIEAKLIAYYSNDEALFNIIQDGISIHNHNAKSMLNLDCEVNDVKDKYSKERQAAKRCGFALFYGAGWRRIQGAFLSEGFNLSEKDCRKIHANMKKSFPEAFEYHEKITGFYNRGKIDFNLLGRPVKIQSHENAYMQGFNRKIQGSASDLNLDAAAKVLWMWEDYNIDAQPLMFVHDSILVEVQKNHAQDCYEDLERAMIDYKLYNDWGQIKLEAEGKIL